MKRKNKLTLHRETLVRLDRARLAKAAGGWTYYGSCVCTELCTESCQTICWGCEPPSDKPTDCECR